MLSYHGQLPISFNSFSPGPRFQYLHVVFLNASTFALVWAKDTDTEQVQLEFLHMKSGLCWRKCLKIRRVLSIILLELFSQYFLFAKAIIHRRNYNFNSHYLQHIGVFLQAFLNRHKTLGRDFVYFAQKCLSGRPPAVSTRNESSSRYSLVLSTPTRGNETANENNFSTVFKNSLFSIINYTKMHENQ